MDEGEKEIPIEVNRGIIKKVRSKRGGFLIISVIIILIGLMFVLYLVPGRMAWNRAPDAAAIVSQSPADIEFNAGRIEHTSIIAAILRCHGIYDVDAIPPEQQPALHLGMPYNTGVKYSSVPLSSTDLSVAYLSKAILSKRADLAGAASSSYEWMVGWQVAIGVIGALSTIVVSINAASAKSAPAGLQGWGIAAIVFSAIATMVASLSTFVDSQGTYATQSQTLAALRQLHSEVATTFVYEYNDKLCPKDAKPVDQDRVKVMNANVQQWTTRLGAIMGGTDGAGAKKGNESSGKTDKGG